MPPAAPLDQRLAAQRGLRSAAWFADLAPTTGRDPASGLELEVDVTGWPTRVTRLDTVSVELRDAAGLLSALRRATGAAALGHLAAVAATGDPSREQLARGAAILDEAVQHWIDLNVGLAGDWDSVQAKLGQRGFEGDVWPDFTSVDLPNLNRPWEPA